MSKEEASTVARQAVAYFDTAEALQDAIDDLESSGFDRAELSFLASEHAVEAKLGHKYRRVEELEDNSEAPRTFFVSTEAVGDAEGSLIGLPLYIAAVGAAGAVVAAGGALPAIIAAAAAAGGTGTVIGALLAGIIEKRHADYIQSQLDHGGLLLWVHVGNPERERRAVDILKKHSGHDVHVLQI